MSSTPDHSIMPAIRYIIDEACAGVENMARDEALLERVGAGDSPPTLRFYQWSPATISLGYFQDYAAYEQLPPPAGGLDVVRRPTGGGAILHDLEQTYALVLPHDYPLLAGGANWLYEHVHSAFAAVLLRHGVPVARGPAGAGGCSHLGPFFCFERHSSFDLLAGGRKLMGSAQRRTRQAVLQHGSLILGRRYEQQQCACVADYAAFDLAPLLPTLAAAIAGPHGAVRGEFTDHERDRTRHYRDKYADPGWTCKR